MEKLKPKLFSVMKSYSKEQFLKDVVSGIIVAIIALPLSIALAIASGVSPEAGLYTAIVGGFIVSFMGGSRVQIGGPTGAFMVIVFGVVAQYGIEGLIIATIMAGVMMIALGLLKMGAIIKFIPYPIITGFTSGIALVIFSSQINEFFGMNITDLPTEFFEKWGSYFSNLSSINITTTLIGILSVLIMVFWPKINKRIPGTLIALLVSSILVAIFNLDVATVGSKFGELSSSLPLPKIPHITFDKIQLLIGPAIVIAFLGSIESLLCAVVSDGMIGSKHRSNMELVAQGTANIGSALFGGIPVTGAIARTVANIKNGGRTPIAGMVHSITLLIILVSLMPLVKLVPMASLSGVLFIVAYNMSQWREFKNLLKSPKSDVAVLLITFVLTVTIDLVIAIEVGMVLSMFLFMKRMSDVSDVSIKSLDFTEDSDNGSDDDFKVENSKYPKLDKVLMYQINGPFFFGATFKYVEMINQVDKDLEYLIIGMKHVPAMDASAIQSFRLSIESLRVHNIKLLITGIRQQPLNALTKSNLVEVIGENNFYDTIEEAVGFIKTTRNQ